MLSVEVPPETPLTGGFWAEIAHYWADNWGIIAGKLIAIETVNNTKDQMSARKLIAARARPQRARLADPAVPLKDKAVESA